MTREYRDWRARVSLIQSTKYLATPSISPPPPIHSRLPCAFLLQGPDPIPTFVYVDLIALCMRPEPIESILHLYIICNYGLLKKHQLA